MEGNHVFISQSYPLSTLLDNIENGDIALPELQRPFVWKHTQIRDLLDSLFRGFPVGFILLWNIDSEKGTKQIGNQEKKHDPRFLVIDGQQRLTSLFSIIKGVEIIDEKFERVHPTISFNPLTAEFEVYNAAIEKDVIWIDDIAEFLKSSSSYSFIEKYLKRLNEKRSISEEEKDRITTNLERLMDVKTYPFTALELSASIDIQTVSEIFVRVNSRGKALNQSDFVMTVLSVYAPYLREQIEKFARDVKAVPEDNTPSPYNTILHPETDHLVRVIVADAFTRGRLKYTHSLLKGVDLETHEESEEYRRKNIELFSDSTKRALELSRWHDYIKILKNIGVVSENLITSKLTVYFTYSLYLHAYQIGLGSDVLEKFVASWLYFSILTSRYIGSPETIFERDLQVLKAYKDPEEFVQKYHEIIRANLTEDFWNITLPETNLVSSSSRNPAYLIYLLVLNKEDVKVLGSNTRIREVLGGEEVYKKNLIDKHHIFPANYLKEKGYPKTEYNQVANMCYLEYPENIKISDTSPEDYGPRIWEKLLEEDVYYHALPDKFWELEYEDFLKERRKLMAKVIYDSVSKILS